jgi:hypothetical protein
VGRDHQPLFCSNTHTHASAINPANRITYSSAVSEKLAAFFSFLLVIILRKLGISDCTANNGRFYGRVYPW